MILCSAMIYKYPNCGDSIPLSPLEVKLGVLAITLSKKQPSITFGPATIIPPGVDLLVRTTTLPPARA